MSLKTTRRRKRSCTQCLEQWNQFARDAHSKFSTPNPNLLTIQEANWQETDENLNKQKLNAVP